MEKEVSAETAGSEGSLRRRFRNSQCKGPEVELCLVWVRLSQEASGWGERSEVQEMGSKVCLGVEDNRAFWDLNLRAVGAHNVLNRGRA